jgi:hypothetical protein
MTSISPAEALRKIQDPQIRLLAESGSKASVDVLIELDLPVAPLRLQRDLINRDARPKLTADSDTQHGDGVAFREFGTFLGDRSAVPPTALQVANAYAARLPADRLIEIAQQPLVSGVVKNRRLSVG